MEITSTGADAATKRKRSLSTSQPPSAPVAKTSRTSGSNQLSINYLARLSQEDLPRINKDDNIPNLLNVLSAYNNVLDRHESLASNLGARPLGPNLIKRFERCFDAPPRVVASHHKGTTTSPEDGGQRITWFEVIEFARSHPAQFDLSTFSEGQRVCQFYYPQRQLRVQISEEDFTFINSGRCQDLIPPLPIFEDEDKEFITCDILESKLKELTSAADMVAARTRQLGHRLKGRKAAIQERRAEGGGGTPAKAGAQQSTPAPPTSSSSGFTPVNSSTSNPAEPALGSNVAVRDELLRHFESLPQNQSHFRSSGRSISHLAPEASVQSTKKSIETSRSAGRAGSDSSSLSPVPSNAFPHDMLSYYVTNDETPTSRPLPDYAYGPSTQSGAFSYAANQTPNKHNFSRPLAPAQESSQPFRVLCQAHMDSLPKGQRVLPPCDRCRRLRMDCQKNLTSCAGCTRKHARCHWREVTTDEVGALDHLMSTANNSAHANGKTNGYANGAQDGYSDYHNDTDDEDDDESNPLGDLEALGEKEERAHEAAAERLREDEEGLKNAKELARLGWEEGMRATSLDGKDETADSPQDAKSVVTGVDVMAGEQPTSEAAPTTNGDVGDTAGVPNQTMIGSVEVPKDSPDDVTHPPVRYGGFRAVNESPLPAGGSNGEQL